MSFRNLLKKVNVISRIGALEKANAVQPASARPYGELTVFEATQKLPIPYYHQLRYLSKRNTSLRTIVHVIQDKVLERDPEFIPRFVSICMECGKEYQNETETCDCGGMTRPPDQAQLEHIKEFFKDCNDNDQSFKAVLHECEDNLNILDDAFLLCLKEYHFDADNNLNYARVREVLSADPEWFKFDLDDKMRQGKKNWTCVEHRTIHAAPGVCGTCGKPLFPVWYIYDEGSTPMPYLKDEIIHWSRYSPSKTFGYPPAATVFEEAMIELNGNVLLNDTYREQRPPKGILAIVTKNLPSLQKFWQKEMEQVQLNPNHMPVMGIESDSGRGSATYTALLNSVADMDVLNVSERMRDGISGLYRITPLYHGGTEGIGGLNAEDVQRAVTAEPIASAHQGYHEEVFPKMLAMFGITDWTLEFPSPYPASDDADLDRRMKETHLASMMHGMGFQVSLDEESGDLIYSGESQAPQPDMGGGMFGGDEDFGDEDGGYQDELLLGKALEKAYKYVTADEAAALSAKGVKIEETKRGKFRYEPAPQRTALTAQPEKIQAAVKDLYAEGHDAKSIAWELEDKHGVKVHPETVNRFLEREGVETVRPKRETVSRADVESRDKILDDMRGAIKDYGAEMDTLRDENAANKKHIEKLESNYTTAAKQTGFLMSQLQKFTEMDRAPTEKEYAAILTEFKEMKHGEPAEPEKEPERQREPPETEGGHSTAEAETIFDEPNNLSPVGLKKIASAVKSAGITDKVRIVSESEVKAKFPEKASTPLAWYDGNNNEYVLNGKVFKNDLEEFEKYMAHSTSNNWNKDGSNLKTVLLHEKGHQIARPDTFNIGYVNKDFQKAAEAFLVKHGGQDGVKQEIGNYAGSSITEILPEAYALTYSGVDVSDDVRTLGELVNDVATGAKPEQDAEQEPEEEQERQREPPETEGSTAEAKQKKITKTVTDYEMKIRDQDYESCGAVDANGNLTFTKDGEKDRVGFTKDDKIKCEGTVFTHNHPQGYSFSPADIRWACQSGMKEMRAISKETGKTYVMKMKDGSNFNYDLWRDKIGKAQTNADTLVRSMFEAAIGEASMSITDANHQHWNEVWTRVATNVPELEYIGD